MLGDKKLLTGVFSSLPASRPSFLARRKAVFMSFYVFPRRGNQLYSGCLSHEKQCHSENCKGQVRIRIFMGLTLN